MMISEPDTDTESAGTPALEDGTPPEVAASQSESKEPSAASALFGEEAEAPAEAAPGGPFGTLGDQGEAGVSAAEREYQEALRAAKALGLDAAPMAAADEETETAEKLAEQLGLDQPVEAPGPVMPDLFTEEAPAPPEPEEVETEEILGPERGDGRAWYVLNTYSGHENRVDENLKRRIESMDVADRIFEIVVPTEEELEIRGGQRRQVQRKLLPGYVLVNMILDDDTWYVVRNTPGVTGFVGAERPHPLPRNEVAAILKQTRVEEPRVRVGFEVGEMVRVMEGPFQDFTGEVDEINLEKGKVRVMISMFGRETPVELDFMQVEKA